MSSAPSAAELLTELRDLIRSVPPSFQHWGAGRTKDFKAVAARATKLVEGRSTSVSHLSASIKEIRSFHGS